MTNLREAAQPDHSEEKLEMVVQPEQAPVAWQWLDTGTFRKNLPANAERSAWNPLYTALPQREWQGLTDEEIDEVFGSPMRLEPSGLMNFVRAIEAKLKEKNNA